MYCKFFQKQLHAAFLHCWGNPGAGKLRSQLMSDIVFCRERKINVPWTVLLTTSSYPLSTQRLCLNKFNWLFGSKKVVLLHLYGSGWGPLPCKRTACIGDAEGIVDQLLDQLAWYQTEISYSSLVCHCFHSDQFSLVKQGGLDFWKNAVQIQSNWHF